jgi:hypothetical protein
MRPCKEFFSLAVLGKYEGKNDTTGETKSTMPFIIIIIIIIN